MIRVTVCGAMGRMGRAVVDYIRGHLDEYELAGAVECHEHPDLAKDIGQLLYGSPMQVGLENDIRNAVVGSDGVIDFSNADGAAWNAAMAAQYKIPYVTGVTGLDADQKDRIQKAAETVPVVLAANFSVGVNLLARLAELAAAATTDEYDCEIVETHHRHKQDAPSGTALRLGEAVAKAWEKPLDELAVHGRRGVNLGERPMGEIGFHAVRGGEVVGEHEVRLLGPAEEIGLSHRAFSRETFVRGAIRALLYLQGKPPGMYDMIDVLGLRVRV